MRLLAVSKKAWKKYIPEKKNKEMKLIGMLDKHALGAETSLCRFIRNKTGPMVYLKLMRDIKGTRCTSVAKFTKSFLLMPLLCTLLATGSS